MKPDTRKVFIVQFVGDWKPREIRILAEDEKRARQSARAFKLPQERISEVKEETANA